MISSSIYYFRSIEIPFSVTEKNLIDRALRSQALSFITGGFAFYNWTSSIRGGDRKLCKWKPVFQFTVKTRNKLKLPGILKTMKTYS